MPTRVTIQFNELPAMSARLESAASQVVAKSAFDIENRAKQVVPVDTGALKNSITTETNGLQATVSAGQEYAVYVEMGTRFQSAQPYMTPAAEVVRPAFIEAMRQLVERGW